jgi:flagellar biogenesis protein FliO
MKPRACLIPVFPLLAALTALGETNTALSVMPSVPPVEFSVLRVMGALLLVLALFFGGVWIFKNAPRFLRVPARSAKLNVLEVRSLGHRHALYVVGYEQQRLLVAATPSGVTLLSQLPSVDAAAAEMTGPTPTVTFADTLRQILGRKSA